MKTVLSNVKPLSHCSFCFIVLFWRIECRGVASGLKVVMVSVVDGMRHPAMPIKEWERSKPAGPSEQ